MWNCFRATLGDVVVSKRRKGDAAWQGPSLPDDSAATTQTMPRNDGAFRTDLCRAQPASSDRESATVAADVRECDSAASARPWTAYHTSEALWQSSESTPSRTACSTGYSTYTCGNISGSRPLEGHPYYRSLRDLNRGSCARVQLAVDSRTGRQVAIKFIPRSETNFSSGLLLRELQNHKACNGHPHIVELLEVFPTRTHLAVTMEYIDGGDMSELIERNLRMTGKPVAEAEARRLFQQLMVAVEYCHRLGIANRDIKLDNMLLASNGDGHPPSIRICDFGLSKDEERQSISQSSCGTPEYVAPEVLHCTLGESYSGKAADVWACGVSLYILIAGAFPFLKLEEESKHDIARMQAMFPRILAGDYQPLPEHISPQCIDLIGRMLTPNPARRIGVADILRHPWVTAGMPSRLAALNGSLISGVGTLPDVDCCSEDGGCSFSALSASTYGHSRTSSGVSLLGNLMGAHLRGLSGDSKAAAPVSATSSATGPSPLGSGTGILSRILSKRQHSLDDAAVQKLRRQLSDSSDGSALSRRASGCRATQTCGQSMQQIVALLTQMEADDRAAEERPWRSLDLRRFSGTDSPASTAPQRVKQSLDLGRSGQSHRSPRPPAGVGMSHLPPVPQHCVLEQPQAQ